MFAVEPKRNCSHIANWLVRPTVPQLRIDVDENCESCADGSENWLCLGCNAVLCSRYVKGHMAEHCGEERKHNGTPQCIIAVSFSDFSFWCYKCESYITNPGLKHIIAGLNNSKFANNGGNSRNTTTTTTTNNNNNIGVIPEIILPETKVNSEEGKSFVDYFRKIGLQDYFSVVENDNREFEITGHLPFERASEANLVLFELFQDVDCESGKLENTTSTSRRSATSSSDRYLSFAIKSSTLKYKVKYHVTWDSFQNYLARKNIGSHSGGDHERTKGGVADMTDPELEEFFDSDVDVDRKVKYLAECMKMSKHNVFFTGAGISTAANIADFRGPNGVWTRRDRGLDMPSSVSFEVAQPTETHKIIAEFIAKNKLSFVVSQNVDGLHRRSGLEKEKLAELHGNAFLEICNHCHAEYLRRYDVTANKDANIANIQAAAKSERVLHSAPANSNSNYISHATGRKCEKCKNGWLMDSIIHFGEQLPTSEITKAQAESSSSEVSVTLGTSLRVSPANHLPFIGKGPVFIVNLQMTPKDDQALVSGGVIIRQRTDVIMKALLNRISDD